MKIKKEYIILAAIIIVLSLYLVLHNSGRVHYRLPALPNVDEAGISKLEISKSDLSIVLNRKGSNWYIAPKEYLADSEKVKEVLDIAKKLTLTALVSELANYNRYGLGNDEKISVKAWTGNVLSQEFEIGKVAPSYRHTFVKLAGNQCVYHARGNFRDKFDQIVDRLRDKVVLSFEKAAIQEISVSKGKKLAVFSHKQIPAVVSQKNKIQNPQSPEMEMVWRSATGKKRDESKINSLFDSLSKLVCKKYINGSKKENFKGPICTIKLKGTKEYALSIFAKKDKNAKDYPAISSESDYPFILSGHQVKNIGNVQKFRIA